ncbi:MAG: hypothetical protein GWN14_04560 [candidate division Zixibacteria bacterium]|nr:hypothetical protein [Gammaproteobacteria bacterium]NIX55209.1 hypothetical protein [candidate division Zixibacteria bacterium]
MKYEEWIKYEELRKQMAGNQHFIFLEPEVLDQHVSLQAESEGNEKSRLLSAILQVFNPRSI